MIPTARTYYNFLTILIVVLLFIGGMKFIGDHLPPQATQTDCYMKLIRTDRVVYIEQGSIRINETPVYGKVCMRAGSEPVGVYPAR